MRALLVSSVLVSRRSQVHTLRRGAPGGGVSRRVCDRRLCECVLCNLIPLFVLLRDCFTHTRTDIKSVRPHTQTT